MFTEIYLLNLGVSVVLPMVVALVTKADAPSAVKAYTLLFLSAVNGFLLEVITAGGFANFDWQTAVVGTVVSFIISVGVHNGLLKPAELTGTNGIISQYGR